jgi:hypothetical protein
MFFMGGILNVDSWRGWCDSVFWADGGPCGEMDFRGGEVVFCKIDEVMRFFEKLRLTRRRIILITRQGCLPCNSFKQIYLPSNVVHWFASNVTQAHPRVEALPLGLGSPDSSTTLTARGILQRRGEGRDRPDWLYVNFRPETNPAIRGPIHDFFKSRGVDWISFEAAGERGGNERFLNQILAHRFVLCPPGNGVDTHRMWEVMLAGAIPVVLRSQAMEPFRDLPILFVDDYREVTQELLEAAWQRIPVPPEPPEMMFADYWGKKIQAAKDCLRGQEIMPMDEWISESMKYGFGMVRRRLVF